MSETRFEEQLRSIASAMDYPGTPDIAGSVTARLHSSARSRLLSKAGTWSLTMLLNSHPEPDRYSPGTCGGDRAHPDRDRPHFPSTYSANCATDHHCHSPILRTSDCDSFLGCIHVNKDFGRTCWRDNSGRCTRKSSLSDSSSNPSVRVRKTRSSVCPGFERWQNDSSGLVRSSRPR